MGQTAEIGTKRRIFQLVNRPPPITFKAFSIFTAVILNSFFLFIQRIKFEGS